MKKPAAAVKGPTLKDLAGAILALRDLHLKKKKAEWRSSRKAYYQGRIDEADLIAHWIRGER